MIDFACIRCGYSTPHRHCMKRHLTNNIKICPAIKNNIDLTPDMVEHILKNRIYKKPKNVVKKDTKSVISHNPNNTKLVSKIAVQNIEKIHNDQSTNSHNTINQQQTTVIQYFINTLDPAKKMEYHHEFIKSQPQSIEDLVSEKYEKERNDMLEGIGDYLYTFKDLTKMISDVSHMKDMKDFKDCVLIDKRGSDQIICYNESNCDIVKPTWENFDTRNAIRFLVKNFQDQLWKNYECSLIRKIEGDSPELTVLNLLVKHLEIYYEFISIFDLEPWVIESTSDSHVLFNYDDDNYDTITSGTRIISKYAQKFKMIEKETANNAFKNGMLSIFECMISDNSKNSHAHFDSKVMNDYTKDPNYMLQMQNRFDTK